MKKIWRTKDGKEITYEDLTDEHLLNIKKHIEKRAKDGVAEIYGLMNDPETYDIDTMYQEEARNHLGYEGICEEIDKRNLFTKGNIMTYRKCPYCKRNIPGEYPYEDHKKMCKNLDKDFRDTL